MQDEQKELTLEDLAKDNQEIRRMLDDLRALVKANQESAKFKGAENEKQDNNWEDLE